MSTKGREQMNRTFAVAIVALVAGAAASAVYFTRIAPAPAPLLGCAGGPHCRDVSIIIVAGVAQIQTIADDKFTQNGVMKWELDDAAAAAGYYFPPDGINFYPANSSKAPSNQAPANEFTGCKAMPQGSANPRKFQCDNAHAKNGTWGYTITVKSSGSAPVPAPLDPYIVNG
jgi:hypothetical protein